MEVEAAYLDWTVRCPHCGDEFVPDEAAREKPPSPRPRRRRRDEEFEDDDYDYVPYRTSASEEARYLVAAPAMWLEICGWLSALAAVGGAVLLFVAAANAANNPNGNQNDEPAEMFVFFGCCVGVFGIPYGVVMAIGARHMRNLSNHGWAMAGAILGVASFAIFGVCGMFQTGFGVWALVTLHKPVVREAFGLTRRG